MTDQHGTTCLLLLVLDRLSDATAVVQVVGAARGCTSSSLSLAQTRKKMNTGHEISPAGARTPPRAHRRPSLFSINSGYMLGYSVHFISDQEGLDI
jgi:hypothetical protein